MTNLFGEEEEDPVVITEERPPVVPRGRGWVLMSNRQGPQGYHRIKTRGTLGSLVTVCGIVGHRIEEAQRSIIECPDCKSS